MRQLLHLLQDERGMTVMEYSLISGIISLATIASVVVLEAKFLMLAAL